MATFAIENGYAEAIIRGFRASFFNDNQYTQIKNCSTLDELKSVPPPPCSSSKTPTTDPTSSLITPISPSPSCVPSSNAS
jgi:hypothetical protein